MAASCALSAAQTDTSGELESQYAAAVLTRGPSGVDPARKFFGRRHVLIRPSRFLASRCGRQPDRAGRVHGPAAPLQLLAYHVAVLRSTDVDQPCKLANSVTVE
ncbi:MAG: hypothetical protein ABI846_04595 [Rudaea sp.]